MALTIDDLSKAPYMQAHLFEGVSKEEAESRASQLNEVHRKLPGGGLEGYLTRARNLLEGAQRGANPFEGLTPTVPTGTALVGDRGPGSVAFAELEKKGMAEISKCAFCLVAGGLGERLGFGGIKIEIMAEVTTGAKFMELYCKHILAFQAYARKATGKQDLVLPLAIMTSGDTHDKTLKLMDDEGYFGMSKDQVTFMKQEKVPALSDVSARIAAKGPDVETKPHGHGDVHGLLHQQGLPDKWIEEGRKWLFVFQDTNPLPFRSLCAILGVSAESEFTMNSVAVPRIPGEAVGGICKLEDEKKGTSLTINVEYNQLDPLLKATPAGGDVADAATGFSPYPGNINVLVFKLDTYSACLKETGGIVPEFVNPKWADAEKQKFKSPTRLECMMQDFPRLCGAAEKIGFTQLDRLMCFTCVKNNLADAVKKTPADCALSAEADMYACAARLLKVAGADVEVEEPEEVAFLGVKAKLGARIVLQPSFAVSLEHMKEKVKGKVRISKKSTLVLEGDVAIDGLELDGSLHVTGKGAMPTDLVVKNAGSALEAIPEANLSTKEPSLQIRGYAPAADGTCQRLELPESGDAKRQRLS